MKTSYTFLLLLLSTLLVSLVLTAPVDKSNNSKKKNSNNVTSDLTTSKHDTSSDQTNKLITNQASSDSSKIDPSTTELPDITSYKNTSTFTCYDKITGYYADVKLGCRVYHFCTQLETLGEITYQRMSYICLEGSIFDQKDLNCVQEADLKVTCDKAEAEFENSNKQFDTREESQPSMSDNLAANIMMNPFTRFIAG